MYRKVIRGVINARRIVNDNIRMYKKSNLKMYKNVHS